MPDNKAIATAPGQATTVQALSGAEQTAHDQRATDWAADADNRKAADEREWRDAELKDTDHWAGSDRTMSAAMTTYRQELRDMPTLTGFPNSHTRPVRPAGE
jgi:hypothetical protein